MKMTGSPDVLFMAEYIKNVLYFATVRHGKLPKNTVDIHYFSIDNELVYENYYSDFGPLNLGCIYKYCKIVNDKLKQFLNKQTIVHYTSIDPKKKTNAAFLLGCYGILYLSLSPRDALKPLMVHGQSYRQFQDATQGDSAYTISLIDCLQALKKARDLGFFNFQDFNYEEYDRLDKIQGGDLNWIIPGKFLAFIGPVNYSVSLYHPPEMYIDYFMNNNVKIVIRLNKRLYDGNVFTNVGIAHYDLFFPDGSCPPRHILFKFLQISEETEDAIAVHCKAGLGRTGSLIGCYLIKHYRMTSHEAIGWMRICRPGSVIGHQQGWLEQLEPWLIKQGTIYRKRMYKDSEKLPVHEFGVYSFTEKTMRQKPTVFQKAHSPPPPIQRQSRSNETAPVRPQASRVREDKMESDEEEIFLTSCDLTEKPTTPLTQIKGCIIKNSTITEDNEDSDSLVSKNKSIWKKYLCCKPCIKSFNDGIWMLAVRCARVTPNKCNSNKCCSFFDMAVVNKAPEKEQYDWRVKTSKPNSAQKIHLRRDQYETASNISRRSSAAGEPKVSCSPSRNSSSRAQPTQKHSIKSNNITVRNLSGHMPTAFQTSQVPFIRNVDDAKNFLMRSSISKTEHEKRLNSSLTITPQYTMRIPNYTSTPPGNMAHITTSSFSTASRRPTQIQKKRCLGRSPSPPQTRATNTPSPAEKFLVRETSRTTLKEVLSRLKLTVPRDGSVGAASLGARRDAPTPKRAPSVRSDERPLATQGDMLNSIKFQRRLRDSLCSDKVCNISNSKLSSSPKNSGSVRNANSRTNTLCKSGIGHGQGQEISTLRERPSTYLKSFLNTNRPASPKGRQRSPHSPSFY